MFQRAGMREGGRVANLNHKLFISQESNIEKLVGVATLPPSLIHALWKIGILLHKQATHTKHYWGECTYLT